jgi:hypothetical protein
VPKRALHFTLIALLTRAKERRLKLLPVFKKSRTEAREPNLTFERTDKALPTCRYEITLAL